MKILFVCRGNVGRSQIAEGIFNNLCKGKHTATSAGTVVVQDGADMEGQKVKDRDMQIVVVMQEIGIDISQNVRNQLKPEYIQEADKAIVMAEIETIPDYLKESEKAIFWEVADIKDQSLEFARNVRNKIELMVSDFVKTLD